MPELPAIRISQPSRGGAAYFGDEFALHWLWKETYNRLASLERAVKDGRAVDEASNFARWLTFSGLYSIFDAHEQPAPMEVSGQKIRELGQRVVAACGHVYKGGRPQHDPSQSKVDEINQKLDAVLAQLAKPISTAAPLPGTFTDSNTWGLCGPERAVVELPSFDHRGRSAAG